MDILHFDVRIRSGLSLEEVGWIVSERVLGGVPLGGREEHIRDEVPAIYTSSALLGMEVILQGESDDEGYYLSGDPVTVCEELSASEFKSSLRDISSLVIRLLKGVEGIEAFPNKGSGVS